MSFSDDVKTTQHLGNALQKGLRALSASDRRYLTTGKNVRLIGSVNLDATLQPHYPNEARWDYFIGQKLGHGEFVHWLEIHPAGNNQNIREVTAKLNWLLKWMRDKPLADHKRQIVWIASGKSAFNQRSQEIRILASRGVKFVGGHLSI